MNCPECKLELIKDRMSYKDCGEFNELVFYKCIECNKAYIYDAKGKLSERYFPARAESCQDCIHYIKTKKFCPLHLLNVLEPKTKTCKREIEEYNKQPGAER